MAVVGCGHTTEDNLKHNDDYDLRSPLRTLSTKRPGQTNLRCQHGILFCSVNTDRVFGVKREGEGSLFRPNTFGIPLLIAAVLSKSE